MFTAAKAVAEAEWKPAQDPHSSVVTVCCLQTRSKFSFPSLLPVPFPPCSWLNKVKFYIIKSGSCINSLTCSQDFTRFPSPPSAHTQILCPKTFVCVWLKKTTLIQLKLGGLSSKTVTDAESQDIHKMEALATRFGFGLLLSSLLAGRVAAYMYGSVSEPGFKNRMKTSYQKGYLGSEILFRAIFNNRWFTT